ncbi:hypothetical protein CRENBAI_004122, partial [Crenichthys baileyi]
MGSVCLHSQSIVEDAPLYFPSSFADPAAPGSGVGETTVSDSHSAEVRSGSLNYTCTLDSLTPAAWTWTLFHVSLCIVISPAADGEMTE